MTFDKNTCEKISEKLLNLFDYEKLISEKNKEGKKINDEDKELYQIVFKYANKLNVFKSVYPNILSIDDVIEVVFCLIGQEEIQKQQSKLNSLQSKLLKELQPICSTDVYLTIESIIKKHFVL